MKRAENQLINTLITLAKNNDEEAITIIQIIIEIQNYGLQAFKRMQELKTAINPQEELSFTVLTIPGDIFINIFSECGVKELGRLMLSSKYFCKLANSDQVWKHLCLKEDLTNFNTENLNWKQLYFDETDFKRYISDANGNVLSIRELHSNEFNLTPALNTITFTGKKLKQVVKQCIHLNYNIAEMKLIASGSVIEDTLDPATVNRKLNNCEHQLYLILNKPETKVLVEKTQPELEILEIVEEEIVVEEETKNNSYCLLM